LPPFSRAYYSGEKERYFWRQGREAVHLYVPVPSALSKHDISFHLVSMVFVWYPRSIENTLRFSDLLNVSSIRLYHPDTAL
jgi:hypothetical protein